MRAALLFASALILAGCASAPSGDGASEYDRLAADCKARGGEFKPIPGAHGPHDAANYVCEFKGSGPSAPAGG
ncbi:MAG TPA: hypothetical protein PLF78_03510 [Caulobacter sp.]|nr:hypothetical protein [Caulobacter sp.]